MHHSASKLHWSNIGAAIVVAVLMVAAPGLVFAQGAQLPPAMEMRVAKAPTVVAGNGASFLAYELHVTNLTTSPLTVTRLEVVSAPTGSTERQLLVTLQDTALARSLMRPGVTPPLPAGERARIAAGLRAVAFLWVPIDGRSPPSRLRHRLTVTRGSGDSLRTDVLDAAPVDVIRDVAVIGPPLRGGPWLTANGPDSMSGHRRALIAAEGSYAIAQRFGIDHVMLDAAASTTSSGDKAKNASYFAQGVDALAVADGIVAATKDSIPENVPGINSRAVPITLETVGGNYVILDIGRGRYAFYAHLQPGSLRVKVGDKVRRGQVVGLVGNSGNSTEPHLHFHLMDGTAPLGSEGLPYVYDSFELIGRCRSFTECTLTAAESRRREMPMANMIVRFPK